MHILQDDDMIGGYKHVLLLCVLALAAPPLPVHNVQRHSCCVAQMQLLVEL